MGGKAQDPTSTECYAAQALTRICRGPGHIHHPILQALAYKRNRLVQVCEIVEPADDVHSLIVAATDVVPCPAVLQVWRAMGPVSQVGLSIVNTPWIVVAVGAIVRAVLRAPLNTREQ